MRRRRAYSETPIEKEKNPKIKEMWQKLTFHSKKQQPSFPRSLPPDLGSYMAVQSAPSTPKGTRPHETHKRFPSTDLLYDSSNSSSSSLKLTKKKQHGFEGKFHSDVIGVTFLEICNAKDLPPGKNLVRTGFDMDPFVVVSYGTSTFRTSSVRHNLNPVWNEKLFFHVRHTDTNYHLKFTVYDKEKFSGNNLVAWCQIPIQDIINQQEDVIEEDEELPMDYHTFPLQMTNPEKWKNKRPTLTIRSKFMPYQQVRKLFWFHLVKLYDAEQTNTLTKLQVQSMLETIGSTITGATIDSFWEAHDKDPDTDELTIEELVDSLEEYMKDDETMMSQLSIAEDEPPMDEDDDDDWDDDEDDMESLDLSDDDDDDIPFDILHPDLFPSSNEDIDLVEELIEEEDKRNSKILPLLNYKHPTRRRATVEKVIRIRECPICHRPNLARKSQMDIITHVATCAANDWTTVDRFLMGDFLTEAYAQRRWFVKFVRKVSYGKYSLGRDNANILVQDRRTGHLIEEKMSVHVRLGMRLVYKRMKSGIQSKGAQRILANLTNKQGRRFDSPKSAKEIPNFIKFHNIQLHEVWKPVSSFKTFNEFFYRKLKPGSRPPDSLDDPCVAVSPADCRMTAFETVSDATRLWIKGREFSVRKLMGTSSREFEGGSLAVFRLAPQDYHRFHSPVDGTITKIKHISGQYYTVNPMAIRTTIDVFGENARTVVWIDSKEFGHVIVVCVGAMLVGSIIVTAKVGDELKRADEMGYFAFGGSTLIVIFEKDKMIFDHDLLNNSDRALETLVRVGNHIGVLQS